MSEMVEVVIDSIRVSLMSQQRIVILREVNAERYLAIWIGIFEAEAINLALQEVEIARPLTWDLLKNVISELGGRVQRVEVVALRDDTFYGNIVVQVNGRLVNIDSRPSDALALAVRANAPIWVAREIMRTAGITPEEDLQKRSSQPPAASPEAPKEEAGEENISAFEDFFNNLNLGDTGESDSP